MNREIAKNQLKEYNKMLKEEGKNFILTPEDLNNLYDIFYIVNWQDYKTLKLNKMEKWFTKFFARIEKIVIPEIGI